MMAVTFCCHKLIMPAWRNNNREKLIKLLSQKKNVLCEKDEANIPARARKRWSRATLLIYVRHPGIFHKAVCGPDWDL